MEKLTLPTEAEPAIVYQVDVLDGLRALPDGCVDLIVTSPPFNLIKVASGGGGSGPITRVKEKYDQDWYADEMHEPEYRDWQRTIIRECLRVCCGSVFYNHRPRYAWHQRNKYREPSNVYHPWEWVREFPVWCEIIWDRGGVGSPNAGRYPIADERLYQIGKPKTWTPSGWSNVWQVCPEREDFGHPCPFPVEIPRRCIIPHTAEGDIVLDPFAGVCSTGVACAQLGRRFLGFEIDQGYIDTGRQRIAGAQGVGGLFHAEPAVLFA